jgi:hypothetical protein
MSPLKVRVRKAEQRINRDYLYLPSCPITKGHWSQSVSVCLARSCKQHLETEEGHWCKRGGELVKARGKQFHSFQIVRYSHDKVED